LTEPPAATRVEGVCGAEELRTLFLFEKLTDDQLDWLCRKGHVMSVEPGLVYTEGEPATCFYVLLSGEVVLLRRVGADDIETVRSSSPGVYGGAFFAYLGDRMPQLYNNSMRAAVPSRFFVLDADKFAYLMTHWFPMATHLLEGLMFGTKSAQEAVGQREKLLALGSLTAGLAHELNNPAAAAVRATAALRTRVAGMRGKLGMIAAKKFEPEVLAALIRMQEEAAERVAKAVTLGPMETSDAEDAVADWLDARGIAGSWDLAPVFVQGGLDSAWLELVAAAVPESALDGAVRWLGYTIESELLLNEIGDSTERISALVGAAKQYSQLDRSPYQVVDVHELLDSTLMMLGGKIGPDITVVKNYDRALPEIARLLRRGGVLAAYDCDWPPWIDWETAAAWERVADRVEAEQRRRGIPEAHQGKDHLGRLQRSGLFRHCAEIAVHGRDQGAADRLVGLAFSAISGAAGFLADGATEDELGFTALREVAARRLTEPLAWWWTYRVRLAVR